MSRVFGIIGICVNEKDFNKVYETDNESFCEFEFYKGKDFRFAFGINTNIIEEKTLKEAREVFISKLLSLFGEQYTSELLENRCIDLIIDTIEE